MKKVNREVPKDEESQQPIYHNTLTKMLFFHWEVSTTDNNYTDYFDIILF